MEIKFKNIHTVKDLTVSLVIIAAGVGLFFLNKGIGVVIAAFGLILLLLYKKGYVREGSDTCLLKKDMELNKACRASVMDYISGRDVKPELVEGNDGGSVRLLIYYNKEEGIAYAQLFDYKGYEYQPASEMVKIRRPRVDRLIDQI